MYCAKLTLIDRRHNSISSSNSSRCPISVRSGWTAKHATGGVSSVFKRNCLIKERNANATNVTKSVNGYSCYGQEEELEDPTLNFTGSSDSPPLQTNSAPHLRLLPPQQQQKMPLAMATLEIDCDLKGVGYNDHENHHTHRDPRPFRVPHNYKQYQQTILSRSFTTFTDVPDKLLPICVRGEKIAGPQLGQQLDEEKLSVHAQNESQRPEIEDNFPMMNERGETNISFYDFQRTWSIENYEDLEDDQEDDDERRHSGDHQRRRRLSASGGFDNKVTASGRYQRRIFRTPSPKTKQVIRVNVVRVANS